MIYGTSTNLKMVEIHWVIACLATHSQAIVTERIVHSILYNIQNGSEQ